MSATFTTTIQGSETSNATGIQVPAAVVEALGSGKRAKVVVTLNGYSYRSTVAPYRGVFMLPLSQEHRGAAGVSVGMQVSVTLTLDTEPRIVDIPEDLRRALTVDGNWGRFEALSYSKRKEAVRQVTDAKTPETRHRRIGKIVADVAG